MCLSGEPIWEQHGKRPHKSHYRLHRLEQQQNRDIKRHDDEQASDKRAHNEFTELFHSRAFLV